MWLAILFAVSAYGSDSNLDPYAAPCPNLPVGLEHVSGNLYRHTIGSPPFYGGLVLITKEGAAVIDPARTCTAIRLKETINSKFHTQVKYVIYTHAHFDHIGGGQVFEGATIVAHENAVEPIRGGRLPTAPPSRTYGNELTLELGGETIELRHLGPSHSNSLSLVYFPKYKALQCTDICGSDSMPYSDLPDFYYDGWAESLRWVLTQDVEVVDDGHHPLASKKQQKAMLDYLTDLHDQILALVRAGKTWDEVQRLVVFPENVKKWPDFANHRTMNILGMYRWVSAHRRGIW